MYDLLILKGKFNDGSVCDFFIRNVEDTLKCADIYFDISKYLNIEVTKEGFRKYGPCCKYRVEMPLWAGYEFWKMVKEVYQKIRENSIDVDYLDDVVFKIENPQYGHITFKVKVWMIPKIWLVITSFISDTDDDGFRCLRKYFLD